MTYNFQNYAIKCDTWQQMLHLAKLAEGQGYWTMNVMFCEKDFDEGCCYFCIGTDTYHCVPEPTDNDQTITYTTFINSHPDLRVEGC